MKYYKHPRTFHVPFSQVITSDDKTLPSINNFIGRNVVVSEKVDGESTTMYRDHIHARSIDSGPHPSREWVKNFWASIKSEIPEGWRISGENMYAVHTSFYDDLESYFLGYFIWNDKNRCLPWDETVEWFNLLGIIPVPVWYVGSLDYPERLDELWGAYKKENTEGYVVRSASSFPFDAFKDNVCKYVDRGVNTNQHWMFSEVKKNLLKGS